MAGKYIDVEVAYKYVWYFDAYRREMAVAKTEMSRSYCGFTDKEKEELRENGVEDFIWESELDV